MIKQKEIINMNDKLMDNIEALHKAVNSLLALEVINSDEGAELSKVGLDKLVNKQQVLLRNDAISYFAELDDQNK